MWNIYCGDQLRTELRSTKPTLNHLRCSVFPSLLFSIDHSTLFLHRYIHTFTSFSVDHSLFFSGDLYSITSLLRQSLSITLTYFYLASLLLSINHSCHPREHSFHKYNSAADQPVPTTLISNPRPPGIYDKYIKAAGRIGVMVSQVVHDSHYNLRSRNYRKAKCRVRYLTDRT